MARKMMTQRQQFWLAHIQAALRAGRGLKHYASAHRLSLGALYNAKSVLKRDGLLKSGFEAIGHPSVCLSNGWASNHRRWK